MKKRLYETHYHSKVTEEIFRISFEIRLSCCMFSSVIIFYGYRIKLSYFFSKSCYIVIPIPV